ncbi:MAG: hypothetical protein H6605_03840 [Flavobacteriales bacterium]|nr:hypothetical protein [Flavobacteriales bacterium]
MRDFGKPIASRFLKIYNNSNEHPRKTTSFNLVRSVGILYDATEDTSVEAVNQVSEKLNRSGKEVFSLGFVDKKKIPENRIPDAKNDFYCQKDLHWYKLPYKDRILRFSNEPFDYLLNVYTADQLPMVGVSALSRANCRLGTFHRKFTACFDFMLHGLENKSTADLLEAYLLYMNKIKNE